MKRILALAGVVILALLYVMTLVFAVIDDPNTMGMFKASIAMTIIVPIMIYGYQIVYRVLKDRADSNVSAKEGEKDIKGEKE